MKAVTLWQPWASLVAANAKRYEFRPQSFYAYIAPPKPGDRIAIHAAMRPVRRDEVEGVLARIFSGDAPDLVDDRARAILEPLLTAFRSIKRGAEMRARLASIAPLGAVVCTAVIGVPQRADEIFGREPGKRTIDYNYAWPLTGIEPFAVPIPATGQQGFWEWRP